MKTFYSAGYFKRPVLFLLLSFINIFVFAASAFALTGNKIDQCYDCHGTTGDVRPIDGAYRNISTGAVVGNHRTHMSTVSTVASCNLCHVSSGFTINHRDGKISFQSNINTSPTAATYSKGVFFNQTSNPILTTAKCSNVNCHFQSTTPNWGATAYQYTSASNNDCNGCHGAPSAYPAPQDGSHPGTGSKHGVYYGIDTGSCVKCHADHTGESAKFAHATSAGNRSLILGGTDLTSANYSLGGPNQNLDYPTYLTNPPASRNGNCTNLYCHSDGTKITGFTQNQAPTWGGTGSCILCHKGDSNAGAGQQMATYSHTKHIAGGAGNYTFGCVKCHAQTVSNNSTIGSLTDHVDHNVTVKFNNSTTAVGGTFAGQSLSKRAPNSGIANAYCSNVYCHSKGTSATAFAPYSTPRWGAALPTNCTACHGGDSNTGKPIATAAHPKHMSTYSYDCSVCHSLTATNSRTLADLSKHVNYAVNVDLNATYGATNSYSQNGHKPGAASGTCTTVYCHSNGQATPIYATVAWSTVGPLACNACHQDAAGSASLSGKHAAHVNNPTILGTSYNCDVCHSRTMSVGSSSVLKTYSGVKLHVNKTKDVAFTTLNNGAAQYSGGACNTLYCHSDGNPVAASRVYANPTWTGAALGCDGCHGVGTGSGYPTRASAGIGVAGSNSHLKHVSGSGITCKECHWNTTQTNTSLVAGGGHLNGTSNVNGVDVKFNTGGNNASGVYAPATQTCATTYCHGTAASLAWGNTTKCNSCHSASKTDAAWAGTNNAHKIHYDSAVLPSSFNNMSGNVSNVSNYRFTCSTCHDPRSGKAQHANGVVDATRAAQVFFSYTTTGHNPTYTSGTLVSNDNGFNWSNGSTACNSTYCHSNGQTGAGFANGAAAVSWSTGASTGCGVCHGTAATATTLSGRHAQHVNNATYLGTNFKCAECHAKTVSLTSDTVITDKTKHVNKFRDYSGAKAGKNIATCNTNYCHSNGKGGSGVVVNWTDTALPSGLACNSCHTNTTLSHPKHLAHSSITCDDCHNNTAASNTALKVGTTTHINGSYNLNGVDLKFANMSAAWKASYSGTTCSTIYCHSNGKGGYVNVTWGATLGCTGCHPSLSGAHSKHVGSLLNNITFYNYTANKSTGNDTVGGWSYQFGCANCHPVDPNMHADGTIEVQVSQLLPVNGGSTLRSKNLAGATYNAATGCDLVYCHSDGRNTMVVGANGHAPVWTTTFAADRCANCHGNSPADATHQAHVAGSIHQDDIFNGTSGKLGTGSTGSVSHGIATQATTISCNICHANTVTSARNDQNTLCVTCHVSGNTVGATYGNNASINNLAMHVNGSVDVAFAGTTIVSKAQLRAGSFVNYTGGAAGWKRSQVLGVDQYKTGASAFDTAKGTLSGTAVWTAGAQGQSTCSNVVCHNMKPGQAAVKWSDTLTCDSCHSSL